MPDRRTVITGAAAAATTLALGTALPASAQDLDSAGASGSGVKSIVDGWYRYLTEVKGYPAVAVAAFRGRSQHSANGEAIFQIGSITKTFTALALAVADRAGQLSLDDPLAKHLPNTLPTLTLAQLASHTSGLPRLPPGFEVGMDPTDPYAHFTEQRLGEALAKTKLESDPGTAYAYSNFGAGLLGYVLGRDYGALVRDKITRPLGLRDTAVTLTDAQRKRKVQGYDQAGAPAKDWQLPSTIAGAGALFGTANDMARYLRAHLGEAPGALRPAVDLVQRPRFTISPALKVGLGWHGYALPVSRRDVWWHDGGTGGFTSYSAFCPSRDTGVVVLVNQAGQQLETIGLAIMDALS